MDVTPRIRTARARDFYQAYLNSPDWRRQRNRALKRAFFRCERCGAKRGLEVHHLTYDRLGHEFDTDLEVLCGDCHEGHHVEVMAASSDRIYLKLASEAQRAHQFSSIADLADEVKTQCGKLRISYDQHQVDKALQFICGTNRLAEPPPRTHSEVAKEMGRPLTHAESREALRRWGFNVLIKTMPSTSSTIDIYGPIPDDTDWGDHDLY